MTILNTSGLWIMKHKSHIYFLMGVTSSDSLGIPQIARQLKACNFPYSIGVTGLYFLGLVGWTFRFADCRARHIVGHLESEAARRNSQSRFICC